MNSFVVRIKYFEYKIRGLIRVYVFVRRRLREPKTAKVNADGRGVPSSVRSDGAKQFDDENSGRIVATRVEEDDRSNRAEETTIDNVEVGVVGKERGGDAGFTVGSPPAPSKAIAKKADVGRSTASTHEAGQNKAIVEVFDRVNTPELLSSSAAIGGEQTAAFSVLPDGEKPCECPDCRTKPTKKPSTSSKSRRLAF